MKSGNPPEQPPGMQEPETLASAIPQAFSSSPSSDQKRCSRCGLTKSLSEFPKHRGEKSNRDGRDSQCKACKAEYSRAWRLANPEKQKAAAERWAKANPEKIKAANERNLDNIQPLCAKCNLIKFNNTTDYRPK